MEDEDSKLRKLQKADKKQIARRKPNIKKKAILTTRADSPKEKSRENICAAKKRMKTLWKPTDWRLPLDSCRKGFGRKNCVNLRAPAPVTHRPRKYGEKSAPSLENGRATLSQDCA
jgi:hypothetical protein